MDLFHGVIRVFYSMLLTFHLLYGHIFLNLGQFKIHEHPTIYIYIYIVFDNFLNIFGAAEKMSNIVVTLSVNKYDLITSSASVNLVSQNVNFKRNMID